MWRNRSIPRDNDAERRLPRRLARLRGCVRRRPKASALLCLGFLLLALNVLAFLHAWSMTHFVADGGVGARGPQGMSAVQKVGAVFTGVRLARPLNTMTPASAGMRYHTHRYRGETTGIEYEAWHVPAGGVPLKRLPFQRARGTVVLFHGYANCKAGLLAEADVVRRAGYDAFLVDFRGSGGSGGSSTAVGYHEADDVAAAVEYVRKTFRPRRTVVYGRSMGAAAALRAVSRGKVHPDALVIESPFDRMLTTVDHRFRSAGLPAFPMARLLVFWGGVQHGYWAFGHNPADYARSVSCPTLMLRAGADPFVRREEAEAVFGNVPAAKRMVVFEGAGHQALVGVDRGRWAKDVTRFLLSGPGAGPGAGPGGHSGGGNSGGGR